MPLSANNVITITKVQLTIHLQFLATMYCYLIFKSIFLSFLSFSWQYSDLLRIMAESKGNFARRFTLEK